MELLITPDGTELVCRSCRDTKRPSPVLDVEQSDTAPLVVHLGYLSHDSVEGPCCLRTGRRKSAPDEAHVREWTSGKDRRRTLERKTRTQVDRKTKQNEGRYDRNQIPKARTSHNQSRRTALRRATPKIKVKTYRHLSDCWDGGPLNVTPFSTPGVA